MGRIPKEFLYLGIPALLEIVGELVDNPSMGKDGLPPWSAVSQEDGTKSDTMQVTIMVEKEDGADDDDSPGFGGSIAIMLEVLLITGIWQEIFCWLPQEILLLIAMVVRGDCMIQLFRSCSAMLTQISCRAIKWSSVATPTRSLH